MKFKVITVFTLLAGLVTGLVGCGEQQGHTHDTVGHGGHSHGGHAGHDDHGHAHGDESPTVTHSVWTDKTELFVEYKPLVVDEVSRFAAHFNSVTDFKPFESGSVTVSLVKDKKGIRHTVDAPGSPGIFTPSLKPNAPGIYTLKFRITTGDLEDEIVIENVEVFASMHDAEHKLGSHEDDPDAISFLKEQAWKMDFATAAVVKDTLYEVLHTGGEIMSVPGEDRTITATTSGIVVFRSPNLIEGASVKNGQLLFSVIGSDLSDNNIASEYRKAKSTLDKAKIELDRKQALYDAKAIAKPVYEEAKLAYELAEAHYQTIASNFGQGGKSVFAGSDGFIRDLFKMNGEFVEGGEPLGVISQNRKLTIRAEVDPSDFNKLSANMSANFGSNDRMYSLSELNGQLRSYGKSVSGEGHKVPVYFEVDNTRDLVLGSYVEVWLKTNPRGSALLVPTSALMEEYGAYCVVIQTGGESFEKRPVNIGISDGRYTEILSGLTIGERVVTIGAYQIKMASMSGQVPAHGHTH